MGHRESFGPKYRQPLSGSNRTTLKEDLGQKGIEREQVPNPEWGEWSKLQFCKQNWRGSPVEAIAKARGHCSSSTTAGPASDKLVLEKSNRVQKSQAEKQPLTEEKGEEEEKQLIIEEEKETEPMSEEEELMHPMTEEKIALLKELSNQVTSHSIKTDKSKGRSRRELEKRWMAAKLEPASKPPNKISDNSHGKDVFVVGKPKEKKSAKKGNFYSKKKSTRVSSQEKIQESAEECNKEDNDVDGNNLVIVEETEQRTMLNPSNRSPTPSCSLCEEPHIEENFELEPESDQVPTEDLQTPNKGPVKEKPSSTPPVTVAPGTISENYVGSESAQLSLRPDSKQNHHGTKCLPN
ncbi:uncharacterized protein LOC115475093 [Microcaecilia unicolor]|uniref:Uncharacterized protein LOC115475093 n=1 Tax=Microcaecilia unicolor TaxID=1415580 RepID=A0A6P7YGX4_9AMPH|nr:uncharacterized protein LOC115475093 [Microcaecilia unicolor]